MSSDDIIRIALRGTDEERLLIEEDYGMKMPNILDDLCCQATTKGYVDLANRLGEAHKALSLGGE